MADTSTLHNALNAAKNYEAGYFIAAEKLLDSLKRRFDGSEIFSFSPAGRVAPGRFEKKDLLHFIITWKIAGFSFGISPFIGVNCCGVEISFLEKKKAIVYMPPDQWVVIENGKSSKAPDVMEILESLIPQKPKESFTIL